MTRVGPAPGEASDGGTSPFSWSHSASKAEMDRERQLGGGSSGHESVVDRGPDSREVGHARSSR